MDALSIIFGLYFIIRWMRDRKAGKRTDEEIRGRIELREKKRASLKNKALEEELFINDELDMHSNEKTYAKYRDYVVSVLTSLYERDQVHNSILFGEFEKAYISGESIINRYAFHERAMELLRALILSQSGHLPVEWVDSFGGGEIDLGRHTGRYTYEIVGFLKAIQKNLDLNNQDAHICILTNDRMRVENKVITIKEIYSGHIETVPISQIHIDRPEIL